MTTRIEIPEEQKSEEQIPLVQRALVLQGGGALGAYEAGVYHVLYHWIKINKLEKEGKNENIFDIIAGTSIGGINATIIISKFLENKEKDKNHTEDQKKQNPLQYWEGTPEHLINYWKKISSHNLFSDIMIDLVKRVWDNYYQFYQYAFPYYKGLIASGESFRRYLSTKKRIVFGEPYVFSPLFFPPFPTPLPNKFLDYFSPSAHWYQYSNQPLKNSILEFASKLEFGGIKTDFKNKNEPRLLLIAADINTSETQAFDSYNTVDMSTTEIQTFDGYNKEENVIRVEHVLASAAIPLNYPFIEIDDKKYWDGGILSNTPVRELISKHTLFWKPDKPNSDEKSNKYDNEQNLYKKWFLKLKSDDNIFYHNSNDKDKNKKNDIPNIELTIVNLHPSKEEGNNIPSAFDYDLTIDRNNDIRFHGKTEYDVKMAKVVSDYHEFVKKMTSLACKSIEKIDNKKELEELKKEFENILSEEMNTNKRDGNKRLYESLLEKRFDVTEEIMIERKDDVDTISDKIYDFSQESVSRLIKEGICDTLLALSQNEKQKEKIFEFNSWLEKYIEEIKRKKSEDILQIVSSFQRKDYSE
jgi:predicted acylesterase/phospholipase RssA